jgi:aldehyde:ferredoxin oxidoreductase
MNGWMGKILHVNLSNREVGLFPTQRYAGLYLGGRGIASRIYWETVEPETSAFDPENRLIFMTGPMAAAGVQGAARLSVVSKSPMAYPEGYCYGNIGGFIGPELKRAGFDGIVVEGRAAEPMYLWIKDDKAELRDASALWGEGVYRTRELLEQAHGKEIRFLTTGEAGERRVRTAVLVASHDSTATAGFGAVMGSKNLKALAVRGNGGPSVADPGRLKELNRHTIHLSKRFRLSTPPSLIGRNMVVECVGKGDCYQCGLECIRGRYRTPSGREGYRKCQSMEVYLPWRFSKDDEPVDTFFDAPTLCNDYSLCTMEVRSILEWLYACYQSGCLTENETGLPLSRIGTRAFLEKLLQLIAHRQGFGDILAEGLVRAGEQVSDEARAMFPHDVVPIGMGDWQPPRVHFAHALLYALEPRMHMPLLHEMAHLRARWHVHLQKPEMSPVSSEVFRAVAKVFWGSEEAADLASYEGKALAAKKIQDRMYLKDSLGLCSFAWPITDSFNTPDHVGDPALESELFSAVTGLPGEELDRYAERIVNLQRAILIREGRRVPESDSIPEYNFTEPFKTDLVGRELIIPGRGGAVVSTVGNVLDREKFRTMLREYYGLRGWDLETGLPRADTLAALELVDLASGFLVKEAEGGSEVL